jgi:lactoylglutathione lyase
MKLNHLNLTVTHPTETALFLEKYFGLRHMGGVPKDNAGMVGLYDDNDMVLVLMRERPGTELQYPGSFHVGFIQESEERVNEINRRLKEDGYDVPPPARMHGSWTFYFRAPGGFTMEVMH